MEVQWLPMVRELVQVRKAIKESFTRLSRDQLAGASFEEYGKSSYFPILLLQLYKSPLKGQNPKVAIKT
jgi:hypothetical protein